MDLGGAAERSLLMLQRHGPDGLVRWVMRLAIGARLRAENRRAPTDRQRWLDEWTAGPVAIATPDANDQHYEIDTELFAAMLGPRLKYSSCLWRQATTLAGAEDEMLAATVETAGISDGMRILDMGCGWGSVSGYILDHFPNCELVAVSTSATQHRYFAERYPSVEHHVADVAEFEPSGTFDRVISVEMVEHLRNHQALFDRVSGWLRPDGAVMLHHFAHRTFWYPFDDDGAASWMARHFFTGGIMPSHDFFATHLDGWRATQHRWYDGSHYARTLETWLERLDRAAVNSPSVAARRDLADWRWFLMACAELFARGDEYGVTHIALEPS